MVLSREQIKETVAKVNLKELRMLSFSVKETLQNGLEADEILAGILDGMETVGVKFKNNEIFLPEVMFTAKVVKECVEILKPALSSDSESKKGVICLGTVKGDNHDIGKNIVKIMLESKGFSVIDVGTDVECETFLNTACEKGCFLIALSALLTTAMPEMEKIVSAVRASGKDIKVMVGGAPITAEFAKSIGADAYGADAAEAAEKASQLWDGRK